MGEVPSLFALCIGAIRKEIIYGDKLSPNIYELPSDLFDCLLVNLPALALQKIQEELPCKNQDGDGDDDDDDDDESGEDCFRNKRKRKRYMNFDALWKKLYESRWPGHHRWDKGVDWLGRQGVEHYELTDDWQQMYWERHLQNCLDEAAEVALLPSFDGCVGEITISEAIVKAMGYEGPLGCSSCDCSQLSYHCHKFGFYARYLRLQNVLCIEETCHLLRSSKLKSLELRWIKSKEHAKGLCKLLSQNSETLKSIELSHCKLSSVIVDAIWHSLHIKGHQTHGIKHFAIKTSRFLESNHISLPSGLAAFLVSGRSLSSLSFSDDHLGPNFAKMVFGTLLDASSGISVLDLSENNITGWLSHFRWRSTNLSQLPQGMGKSLPSLRLLNLRGNNLHEDDAKSLQYALVHMPNLEILDISDNPIEDNGVKNLIPILVEISERHSRFADLKVENCNLSSEGVSELLSVLSTLKQPLDALSIRENDLGSKMGAPVGKFLCTGIRALDIEDTGLGSNGFLEALDEIREDLNLVYINISKNRGGIETANFLSKLILRAPQLVAVNAGYNFVPVESLSVICSALKVAKGKLQHVDLTGNIWCNQAIDVSMLDEFKINGKPIFRLPSLPTTNAPYDDDP